MSRSGFEFKGVVRLTTLGTGYLVFALLIGFAALNTGNNSLYITLALMLGTLLISGIASKGALKHLQVTVSPIGEVWAGRTALGELQLKNRSPIWNLRDLVITSEHFEHPIIVPVMARASTVSLTIPFKFPRRGLQSVGELDFYTRYPFGFFLKKRRFPVATELVVYPRLLDDPSAPRFTFKKEGDTKPARQAGSGTDIHAFKEYVRGDSLRQVHWKKSASIGRWIMKQTELESDQLVRAALDPFVPTGTPEEDFEELISAAATYIESAMARGAEASFRLPGKHFHAGPQNRMGIFQELAVLGPATKQWTESLENGTTLFKLGTGIQSRTA